MNKAKVLQIGMNSQFPKSNDIIFHGMFENFEQKTPSSSNQIQISSINSEIVENLNKSSSKMDNHINTGIPLTTSISINRTISPITPDLTSGISRAQGNFLTQSQQFTDSITKVESSKVTKEIVKVLRIDKDFVPEQDSKSSEIVPIEDLTSLFKQLPEEVYGIMRSRKAGNTQLSILRDTPIDLLPVSDMDQLKIIMDRPVEIKANQELVIEHIPANSIEGKWSILDVVRYRTPLSWEGVFQNCLSGIREISNQIAIHEKQFGFDKIVPHRDKIFRAFELTPLYKVNVVIIGQDPYHQVDYQGNPIAQGLSFSVPKHFRLNSKAATSVQHILQVVSNTIEGWKNFGHGCLDNWAVQGVLMLNSALTTVQGVANQHKTIWSGFISEICKSIISVNPGVIFVLWGGDAQKLSNILGDKVIQIKGPHPVARDGSFLRDNNHFQLVNYILYQKGKPLIDWNLEPSSQTGLAPATGIDANGSPIRKGNNQGLYGVSFDASKTGSYSFSSTHQRVPEQIPNNFQQLISNQQTLNSNYLSTKITTSSSRNFTEEVLNHESNIKSFDKTVINSSKQHITQQMLDHNSDKYSLNLSGSYISGANMDQYKVIESPKVSKSFNDTIKISNLAIPSREDYKSEILQFQL